MIGSYDEYTSFLLRTMIFKVEVHVSDSDVKMIFLKLFYELFPLVSRFSVHLINQTDTVLSGDYTFSICLMMYTTIGTSDRIPNVNPGC